MALLRRGYADTSIGQIHFRESGTGRVLVLLHQTPSSSQIFNRLIPHLADNYRVIAFDTPGFGMSDSLPSEPRGMSAYARVIGEAMDDLEIGVAHLVGHHTGASIGIELCRQRPELVERLVIASALALETEDEREQWMKYLRHFTPDTEGAFLSAYPLPYLTDLITPGDGQQYLDELISYLQAGPTYWWAYRSLFEYDAADAAASIDCPVLVINARDDHYVFDSTRRLAEHLPACEYLEVDGTHQVVLDTPLVFAEAVKAFLAPPTS